MKKKEATTTIGVLFFLFFFFHSILYVLYEVIMRNVPDCEKQECNNNNNTWNRKGN